MWFSGVQLVSLALIAALNHWHATLVKSIKKATMHRAVDTCLSIEVPANFMAQAETEFSGVDYAVNNSRKSSGKQKKKEKEIKEEEKKK